MGVGRRSISFPPNQRTSCGPGSGDPTDRWLLGEYIVDDDIAWLEHALDRELITPDHAADTYSAFALHPSIEQMARLLVPRGIEPRRIAFLAQAGSWTGEESHRYGQIAEEFEALKGSDDASVAAVGNAGARCSPPLGTMPCGMNGSDGSAAIPRGGHQVPFPNIPKDVGKIHAVNGTSRVTLSLVPGSRPSAPSSFSRRSAGLTEVRRLPTVLA